MTSFSRVRSRSVTYERRAQARVVTPGWRAYEEWITANAASICAALGLDVERMSFRAQVHKRSALSHRVDVIGEADGRLIVIEVKDRHPLPREEAMAAVYRVIDLALANPDLQVAGILITSNAPSRAVRTVVRNRTGVFHAPRNLALPQHLVMTPPEVVSGHVLLRRYDGPNVSVSVMNVGPAREIGELEHAIVSEPELELRLGAALEVLAHHGQSALSADAAYEAAICLLHLGRGSIVVDMRDQLVANAAVSRGDQKLERTELLLDMAFFQTALQRASGGARPAKPVIRGLGRRLTTLAPGTRVGAQQFLGSWLGLYDDPALARKHLDESLGLADQTPPAAAAHYRFMGHVRLAELATGAERESHLAEARRQLTEIDPVPRRVAQEMYDGMMKGRDTSIASHFGRDDQTGNGV